MAPPRDLDLDRVDHWYAPHLHKGVPAGEVVPRVQWLGLSVAGPLLLALSRRVQIPVPRLELARVEHPLVEASVLSKQVVVRSQDCLATDADLAEGLVRAVQHLRVPAFAQSLRTPFLFTNLSGSIDVLVDRAAIPAPLRLGGMGSLLRECSPELTVGSLLSCRVESVVSRCVGIEAGRGLVFDD